jgi:SAM-dependent methyltransferase
MFVPVTEALIADANVTAGSNVLDVGTGGGEPALSIARFVGSGGKVYAIDPAPEMIEAARREAIQQTIKNVEFEVASADHLSLRPKTFDAVVSRFAIMFFESPVEAIRNLMQALKPGGRLAFAVWYLADHNPYFALTQVVERYLGPTPPNAPDPFRFAGHGKLLQLFNEAGVKEPSERLLRFKIEAPVSAEEFWELRSEMSDRLRSSLPSLPAATVTELRKHAIDNFLKYSTEQGMSIPAEVLIVSGMR